MIYLGKQMYMGVIKTQKKKKKRPRLETVLCHRKTTYTLNISLAPSVKEFSFACIETFRVLFVFGQESSTCH